MFERIQEALLAGNKDGVERLVEDALRAGTPAARILDSGLIPGMERLGVLFKNNEIFIPEVLVSSRAMRAGLARLEPHLVREKVEPRGVVVLGTVRGDLHDIGKNLVGMMLRGAGYRVVDLGADVPPERFVEAARSERADVVGLSALLTTTMVHMKGVIDALRAAGLGTPVVVGGAPLTREYADGIGARGYAPDAASAVTLVNGLL
ncbi:MAG: methyltransferase [Candidatus Aminicenantes bacterium RBG_13_63_10]|nr:MAG: methyltransferase [Candidatus Aminicenantes bacterium RBG_13_63_10]